MNLFNPAHLKVALLCKGVNITNEAKKYLGNKFQEKIYSYSITDWVDKKIIFPSEIKLSNNVYVGFHYRSTSEFTLDYNGNELFIFQNKKPIMKASLIQRPKYYNATTSDNVPLQSIGVSCTTNRHFLVFFARFYFYAKLNLLTDKILHFNFQQ